MVNHIIDIDMAIEEHEMAEFVINIDRDVILRKLFGLDISVDTLL